jgi:hypothetical protein
MIAAAMAEKLRPGQLKKACEVLAVLPETVIRTAFMQLTGSR